ncbi:MAG: nitroreductase family protein [Planctomycetes bacterium]|nr:nitroreductase family protein [Planctomycetota bacterium]
MDTLKAIEARRSIRKFKPDPVDPAQITSILEAGRLAPSGTNCQPWKFLVVRDAEKRRLITECAYGQKMIAEAPVTIVLLGDRQAYKKRLRRGMELVEIGAVSGETMEKVGQAYKERGNDRDRADNSIVLNCAIAGQQMIIAATALGLGTCWVMLIKKEELATALSLPENLVPVALIPLGHPDQNPAPRPRYDLGEIAWDEEVGEVWEG